MDEDTVGSAEIVESDIVFDCQQCGKSLAIDFRGAGLTVRCADCGGAVQVPIPEGMEIADVDTSAADREALLINLRHALAGAGERIAILEQELADTRVRRKSLEGLRSDSLGWITQMRGKSDNLQRTVKDFSATLDTILQEASGKGEG